MYIFNVERLIRSNFILANVQRAIPNSLPFYVKWGLARAFNGAVLCSNKTVLTVLFYDPSRDVKEGDDYIVRLPTMRVSGYLSSDSKHRVEADEFAKIVTEADGAFNSEVTNIETALKEIRTFELLMQHQAAIGSEIEYSVDSIVASLREACGQDIIVGSVRRLPSESDNLYETELFIEFDPAMHETELVRKLKTLIPSIESPLYGSGYRIMSGAESKLPGVIWGHLIARHF